MCRNTTATTPACRPALLFLATVAAVDSVDADRDGSPAADGEVQPDAEPGTVGAAHRFICA